MQAKRCKWQSRNPMPGLEGGLDAGVLCNGVQRACTVCVVLIRWHRHVLLRVLLLCMVKHVPNAIDSPPLPTPLPIQLACPPECGKLGVETLVKLHL